MGLGTGIALLVIGGILAFGVQDSIEAINLTVIGYICMAAGALAIILSLVVSNQRRSTAHTEVIDRRGGPPAPPNAY